MPKKKDALSPEGQIIFDISQAESKEEKPVISQSQAQEDHNYIFPNIMAKLMAKVDQRTQYEASMMSMAFICIGLILTIVYFSLYVQMTLWYKIVIIANAVAGIVLISSSLVTVFQQYQQLMGVLAFQKEMKYNQKGGPETNGERSG